MECGCLQMTSFLPCKQAAWLHWQGLACFDRRPSLLLAKASIRHNLFEPEMQDLNTPVFVSVKPRGGEHTYTRAMTMTCGLLDMTSWQLLLPYLGMRKASQEFLNRSRKQASIHAHNGRNKMLASHCVTAGAASGFVQTKQQMNTSSS